MFQLLIAEELNLIVGRTHKSSVIVRVNVPVRAWENNLIVMTFIEALLMTLLFVNSLLSIYRSEKR